MVCGLKAEGLQFSVLLHFCIHIPLTHVRSPEPTHATPLQIVEPRGLKYRQLCATHSLVEQEQEGAGALPLEGSIPDMTATTELYLQLQRIYRSKADEHCAAVLQHTQDLLAECGHDRGDVQMEDVKAFCRNARHLRVLRFRCIAAEASAVHADGLRQVCTSFLLFKLLVQWACLKLSRCGEFVGAWRHFCQPLSPASRFGVCCLDSCVCRLEVWRTCCSVYHRGYFMILILWLAAISDGGIASSVSSSYLLLFSPSGAPGSS
jgi:hypothetical protein